MLYEWSYQSLLSARCSFLYHFPHLIDLIDSLISGPRTLSVLQDPICQESASEDFKITITTRSWSSDQGRPSVCIVSGHGSSVGCVDQKIDIINPTLDCHVQYAGTMPAQQPDVISASRTMDKSASVGCVIPSSFKSLASYQTAHKSQVTTQCIMYVSDREV